MGTALSSENRKLFAALLLNFILFGVSLTIIGATVPKVIREFGWSYLATGMVLAASAVGYFVSSFFSGLLVFRFGPRIVILLGLGLQAVGLGSFGAVPGVLANLCATLLLGLGQGGTEVVTNFSVARMEAEGQSRLMNLMHAAFPMGAILGPILIGVLISVGQSWQAVFRAMALLSLGVAGLLSLLPFRFSDERDEGISEKAELSRLLRDPLLMFLFLTIFLYVGCEIGISSWVSEYYVEVFKTPAAVGAYMVSVFWAGVLVGRLSVSLGYRGHRQAEVLVALSCLAALALMISLSMKGPLSAGVGFLLCGLGCSAIYPIDMSLVGANFKRGQSVAIGIVSTGGGIGSFLFPFVMAAIANSYGIENGFWFYVTTALGMAGSASMVTWLVRRKGKGPDG